MRTKFLAAVVLMAAIGTLAQAGLNIKVLTENNTTGAAQVYDVFYDGKTGTATAKVDLAGSFAKTQGSPNSLGYSGSSLFTTTGPAGPQSLTQYDATSGAQLNKTSLGTSVAIAGGEATGNTFYYFSDAGKLGTVKNIFGSPMVLAEKNSQEVTKGVSLGDIAIDQQTGLAYLAYQSKADNKFYIANIDLATGLISNKTTTGGVFVNGLGFDSAGQLYGTIRDGSPATGDQPLLALINKNSRTISSTVAINGFDAGYAITDAASVPVPPVAAMALGALVGVPMLRRFRKQA